MSVEKINLSQKFSLIQEFWSPRLLGEVNDFAVKIARLQGQFVWHHHEEEDELFLVVAGHLSIHLRDQKLELNAGEMVIIPRGVEHMPEAAEEAQVLMLERKGTLNTGNVENERTLHTIQKI